MSSKPRPKTRAELFVEYAPLVHFTLRRFRSTANDYDDMYQVGCIGLLRAIDGFDAAQGFSFSTYATSCIRGYVMSDLTRRGSLVRSPDEVVSVRNAVGPTVELLLHRLKREPTMPEIAAELGITVEALYLTRAGQTQSMDATDFPEIPVADAGMEAVEDADHFDYLLSTCDRVERAIAIGLSQEKTQRQIAGELGLDYSTVSRIISERIRPKLAEMIAS